MKAGLSIAILALLNNVSATDLKMLGKSKQTNRAGHKLIDESQAWRNYFQKNGQDSVAIQLKENAYWDNKDAEEEDDKSYEFLQTNFDHEQDTDDMPDNLTPAGFYVEDSEVAMPQHKNYSNVMQPEPVKEVVKFDHETDTEDIPEQPEPLDVYNQPNWFVQTSAKLNAKQQSKWHENDTDDVPMDPYMDKSLNYLAPLEHYPAAEEDMQYKQKMRWQFTKENDTDDIAFDQDPVMLQTHMRKQKKHMPVSRSLIQMDINSETPHEDDTDDVGYEKRVANSFESYDIQHSKEWNDKVNKQADEIDQQMLAQEAAEQAVKDNARAAQREKEADAYRTQQLAQSNAKETAYINNYNAAHAQKQEKTGTDIYGYFENEINAGSSRDDVPSNGYNHHSKYFEDRVNEQAYALEQQMATEDDNESTIATAEVNHKTIDLGDVYDKMNLQTGFEHYQHHSKYYQAQVNQQTLALEKELNAADEAEEYKSTHPNQAIVEHGMTPTDNYVHHPNPSVDLESIYQGVELVQLSDHENDEDDIVPELSEAVKLSQKPPTKELLKTDFAGEKFQEVYDD